MIKLNRTTEYGLMALRHMSRKREAMQRTGECEFTSAREVSDLFGLPFEITAKTLQRMKETGLIQSAQGARGGYTLERSLQDITLAEFLELMEGPQAVVACASPVGKSASVSTQAAACGPGSELSVLQNRGCEYESKCEVKSLLGDLNARFINFLSGIRLAELTQDSAKENTKDKV
jgi:Rrf2 family protein